MESRLFLLITGLKGQRVKEEQDAIDAVLTASTFSLTDTDSKRAVSECLQQRPNSVLDAFSRAKQMIANRLPFAPKTRKQRSDCYRDAARACIHDFCHSEEGSNVDTESYRVYKIKDPDTGEVENHPARVWNETSNAKRYQSFTESSMYKEFQDKSLGDKTLPVSGLKHDLAKRLGECLVEQASAGNDVGGSAPAAVLAASGAILATSVIADDDDLNPDIDTDSEDEEEDEDGG